MLSVNCNCFQVEINQSGLEKKDEKRDSGIFYGIDDIPPWYLSIPMAFQVNRTTTKNYSISEMYLFLVIL